MSELAKFSAMTHADGFVTPACVIATKSLSRLLRNSKSQRHTCRFGGGVDFDWGGKDHAAEFAFAIRSAKAVVVVHRNGQCLAALVPEILRGIKKDSLPSSFFPVTFSAVRSIGPSLELDST